MSDEEKSIPEIIRAAESILHIFTQMTQTFVAQALES